MSAVGVLVIDCITIGKSQPIRTHHTFTTSVFFLTIMFYCLKNKDAVYISFYMSITTKNKS